MGIKGEGNRQRIVEAAESLFYRRGYNQTSFQDISDATDIPRGNFYYYFKTKEEILNAVIDGRISNLSDMLSRYDKEIPDARERLLMLSNILEHERDDMLQSGCPLGTLSSELAKGDSALHDKSKQAFIVLYDWVKRQFEILGLSNAGELAMDLLAKLQGVSVVASVFKDAEYVKRSHLEIQNWINQQN